MERQSLIILFESKENAEKCKPRLEEYIKDMEREQPTWVVLYDFLLSVHLYDKDED